MALVGVMSRDGILEAKHLWLLYSVNAPTTHVAISCFIALVVIPSVMKISLRTIQLVQQ